MRLRHVMPRLGAAIALSASALLGLAGLAGTASAATGVQGTGVAGSRVQSEGTLVEVRTWAHTPTPAPARGVVDSWIDAAHGPALDRALVSTPLLVATLLCALVGALVMARRAARDTVKEH